MLRITRMCSTSPPLNLTGLSLPRCFCLWQADVTVQLTPEDGVDDVTYNVINTLLEFIDSNPPKWQKWKEKANQAGIEWA